MSEKAYEVVHLDELDRFPVDDEGLLWRPVRRRLGITAFGMNAYTAEKGDERVVEEHPRRTATTSSTSSRAAAPRSSSARRRSTRPPARSSMPSPGRSAAPSPPSRTRPSSRSARSRASRTRSPSGRRSSSPSATTGRATRPPRASTSRSSSPRTRRVAGPLQPRVPRGADEEPRGRDRRAEARDRARPAGEGVRGEGRGLRLAARRPGVPGVSGTATRLRPRASRLGDGLVVGDGADALRHPVLRSQCVHRRGARDRGHRASTTSSASGRASTRSCISSSSGRATFTVNGDEIDAPAGTFVFVRDPAAKRTRDRRGGGHDGRHRRRQARRGIHAVSLGAEGAQGLDLLRERGLRAGGRDVRAAARGTRPTTPASSTTSPAPRAAWAASEKALEHLRAVRPRQSREVQRRRRQATPTSMRSATTRSSQRSPGRWAPPARARSAGTGSASGRATSSTAP